jgi:ribonuclease P protein component
VSRDASRTASRNFVVLAARRPPELLGEGARLGITVTRRVGKAVTRNRVKRQIRECFRRRRRLLGAGLDVVVIARGGAAQLLTAEVETELGGLFGGLSG